LAAPYGADEKKRATELTNVARLGEVFRSRLISEPVRSYDEATKTTMGCKHWTLVSLGIIFRNSRFFAPQRERAQSPFSEAKIKWQTVERAVDVYADVMAEQAGLYNEVRGKQENIDFGRIWAYQTQSDLIVPRLGETLFKKIPEMRPANGS
jgi:hypothetical protein